VIERIRATDNSAEAMEILQQHSQTLPSTESMNEADKQEYRQMILSLVYRQTTSDGRVSPVTEDWSLSQRKQLWRHVRSRLQQTGRLRLAALPLLVRYCPYVVIYAQIFGADSQHDDGA
jgi:hypothetical protein